MQIIRQAQHIIQQALFGGKIIIMYGARQVGKTTLSKVIAQEFSLEDCKYIDCDILSNRQSLSVQDPNSLKRFIGNYRVVVIDEAQRIANVGIILKILHNYMPDTQFIATGSSSFDLSNKISEPLTGRSKEFLITPFSAFELQNKHEIGIPLSLLHQYLMYGSYPEVVQNSQSALSYLKNITSNYLYKDILELDAIKKSDQLIYLLQLLARQIGNEVSYNEIAQRLGMSVQTIQKYISLLEKSFIIYRLPSYKKNLRNEIAKSQKIYFRDLGIRNALIDQFADIQLRNDVGHLRENFAIIERQKYLHNTDTIRSSYFRRNHQGAEIDYIEISPQGEIELYEYKRNSKKSAHVPKAFADNYDYKSFSIITPDTVESLWTPNR